MEYGTEHKLHITSMKKEGKDFGEALKDAQKKLSEADPRLNSRHDTCRKIAFYRHCI